MFNRLFLFRAAPGIQKNSDKNCDSMTKSKGETETRYVMLSPDSIVTPENVRNLLVEKYPDLTVKETCFGAMIEGGHDEIMKAVEGVRSLDKNGVYSKQRGFPIGDSRVCRADRGGGPRPGFYLLEQENKMLPWIRSALDMLDRGGVPPETVPRGERLKVDELKKIVDEIVSDER